MSKMTGQGRVSSDAEKWRGGILRRAAQSKGVALMAVGNTHLDLSRISCGKQSLKRWSF
ncbi:MULTISPECIES: hypothetical protein [unclassified Sphingopyxis]|uniref:hypothetical protein n=1 Tax=unclassified Sphingopyxis TaxID=2614943 RepID=UPI0012E3EAB1|nr:MULTISPECIES: hypothetical protein [unclassified Sphingopyxis]